MKSYRCLVFDWDGTLIDSMSRIVACTEWTLDHFDLPAVSTERIRSLIGLDLKQMLSTLAPGFDRTELLAGAYRDVWLSDRVAKSVLFSDCQPLLQRLKRAGVIMAIATGKSRVGLMRELGENEVGDYFQTTRSADRFPSKPDPTMLSDLLEAVACRPDQALMIGDSVYDLEMARNLKVDAVGITTGAHSREALVGCSPRVVLPSLTAFESWFFEPETPAREA